MVDDYLINVYCTTITYFVDIDNFLNVGFKIMIILHFFINKAPLLVPTHSLYGG